MTIHWTLPIVLWVVALGAAIFLLLPTTRWQIVGTVAYVLATATLGYGAIYLLGQPKPLSLEFNSAGSPVLSFYPDEPKAIYLWVLRDGTPKTLVIPWERSTAEKMQDQQRLMMLGESDGMVLGDRTLDGRSVTHARPPRPLPPKETQ